MFTRSDSKNDAKVFRICQEGIDVIMDYMQQRVIYATAADVFTILHEDTPFIDTLSVTTQDTLSKLGQFWFVSVVSFCCS